MRSQNVKGRSVLGSVVLSLVADVFNGSEAEKPKRR
jgi:hypothetical protein